MNPDAVVRAQSVTTDATRVHDTSAVHEDEDAAETIPPTQIEVEIHAAPAAEAETTSTSPDAMAGTRSVDATRVHDTSAVHGDAAELVPPTQIDVEIRAAPAAEATFTPPNAAEAETVPTQIDSAAVEVAFTQPEAAQAETGDDLQHTETATEEEPKQFATPNEAEAETNEKTLDDNIDKESLTTALEKQLDMMQD